MEYLKETIRSLETYKNVLGSLRANLYQIGMALPRSARLPFLAALHSDLQVPIIYITARSDQATRLHDELGFWLPESSRLVFSEPTPLFYEDAVWGNVTRRERLIVLSLLAQYHLPLSIKPIKSPIIISSVRALMTRTISRRDFLLASKQLIINQSTPINDLVRLWAQIGYQNVNTVYEPGQFSRRGGLLDIWPQFEAQPIRMDFFGDVIDSMWYFDPYSQRASEKIDTILVPPAREFIVDPKSNIDNINRSEILTTGYSEFHIPVLHPYSSSVIDYLPKNALIFVDDWSLLESTVNEIDIQASKQRAESITEGTLTDDFPVPYFSWQELFDGIQRHRCISLGFSSIALMPNEGQTIEHPITEFGSVERFGGRLKPFMEYLEKSIDEDKKVIVVSRQSSRLTELWNDTAQAGSTRSPIFVEGSLSEGWQITGVVLITDSEIFGWERPQPRAKLHVSAETPEMAYADLNPGDWVVHVDYGIGRFLGLVCRSLEGLEREFLCIEYRNGDQVFVPVYQADRLTRYLGQDGSAPSLSHLGTQEWSETKQRAKEAVKEVASDLLELYARRIVAEGYAFQNDNTWQSELEASFPYMETPDQQKALAEIKRDMEAARPMDRLLCGDVGYGKTEVALRAAFKAVMSGKQVAFLVPTTVLAQQHYDTFRQRLSAFPVTVEMLSRFRTPREQSQIIRSLAEGSIDILIGTHRLISSDVQFKDLGLVVIDEEQRFGVAHKERLKQMRTEVDVLTLTATPIPRTLYMALTGVRDISNLNTPPEERLPIITHIGPYSVKLIRQAILRETERGGQVFFVHNRVQTIYAMKMHLDKLVPEARVAIGHGQMPEKELASVMHRFTKGDVDVLLATSIIESGLDIPNANTLIVDRGDTFGLAQLYQLRGRVGRGASRAYAYFFRHRKLTPTPEGQERLEIIAENTQLGAGYSIAMRDLEMRGAGELLGTHQSGHIAAIGFHLYTRLLSTAVRNLRQSRGLPQAQVSGTFAWLESNQPVSVDLPLSVGIPSEYIVDQGLRLRLYRRLADVRDESELDALAEEFEDRFGPCPAMVTNLLFQIRVKLRAAKAGLASVGFESGQIILRYPLPPVGSDERRLPELGAGVRSAKNAYWCTFGRELDWQKRLLSVLDALIPIEPVVGK